MVIHIGKYIINESKLKVILDSGSNMNGSMEHVSKVYNIVLYIHDFRAVVGFVN